MPPSLGGRAAAMIIPEAISAAVAAIDHRHRAGMWALTGLLGGAGLIQRAGAPPGEPAPSP